MKRILLIVSFAFVSIIANAQIVYQPFIPNDSRSRTQGTDNPVYQSYEQTRTAQTQTMRATAYAIDSDGDYVKVPIQITATTYSYGGRTMEVTSYYGERGWGNREWIKCAYAASIKKCDTIWGNEMDKRFMYKANIPYVGWVYFDL